MHAFQNPVAKPTGDQTPIAPVLSEQDIPSKTLQQVETERLQDWLKDSPRSMQISTLRAFDASLPTPRLHTLSGLPIHACPPHEPPLGQHS